MSSFIGLPVPHLIEFSKIGGSVLGYITVAEVAKNIPFDIQRVYWTYYTPDSVQRGGHAHYDLEQIIFAVSGQIIFNTEMLDGTRQQFVLDRPNVGLYLPRMVWRDIQFSHNAVLLCLASAVYAESDYIRQYEIFKSHNA